MPPFYKFRRILDYLRIPGRVKNSLKRSTAKDGENAVYGKRLGITEDEKRKRVELLTPREREVYHLLLQGYTLKESAKLLSLKYSTVNTHMTGIYRKLEVSSRAEFIINYRDIGAQKGNE